MPPALQSLVERLGGLRRVAILGVGALAVVLVLGVSRWATAPTWVPAFSGIPLEQAGRMTEQLEQAGIEYRLEQGGAQLLVKSTDLARARVALAEQGLPSSGRPGLELFDQPSWGMTDFTQRINYRRALEGELERTIGKMRGVELAQVHLALPEQASFRRAASEKPAQASVVLRLTNGQRPAADVVQGIQALVASSVSGIENDHVTVIDDAGRLLSDPYDLSTPAGLTNRQLAVQREVEGYLEAKAEELTAQIVGAGNARVQVAAQVNFDQVARTVETVDPDKQAIATEQKSEIVPGQEGGAASSNMATSYETSRATEQFTGAVGNVRRLTVGVLVNDRLIPDSTGKAPTVVARTPEELARIETLVRAAVGLDSARGDLISVVSIPFDVPPPMVADEPTGVQRVVETFREVQQPAMGVLGLLLAFAIALMALRALKAPAAAEPERPSQLAGGAATPEGTLLAAGAATTGGAAQALREGAEEALIPPPPKPRPRIAPVIELPSSPSRETAVASVEQHPDVAARIMRAWLKEA